MEDGPEIEITKAYTIVVTKTANGMAVNTLPEIIYRCVWLSTLCQIIVIVKILKNIGR